MKVFDGIVQLKDFKISDDWSALKSESMIVNSVYYFCYTFYYSSLAVSISGIIDTRRGEARDHMGTHRLRSSVQVAPPSAENSGLPDMYYVLRIEVSLVFLSSILSYIYQVHPAIVFWIL